MSTIEEKINKYLEIDKKEEKIESPFVLEVKKESDFSKVLVVDEKYLEKGDFSLVSNESSEVGGPTNKEVNDALMLDILYKSKFEDEERTQISTSFFRALEDPNISFFYGNWKKNSETQWELKPDETSNFILNMKDGHPYLEVSWKDVEGNEYNVEKQLPFEPAILKRKFGVFDIG